jgi:hypothetical protein
LLLLRKLKLKKLALRLARVLVPLALTVVALLRYLYRTSEPAVRVLVQT